MLPSVHQDLPQSPPEDLARQILGDPSSALTPVPIFASLDHRSWTVLDAHPSHDAFVVLNPYTSTGYCVAAPTDTGHKTRNGVAAAAIRSLASHLEAPGWAPVPRDPEAPTESAVSLARHVTAALIGLSPFDVTAQHTLVTLDLSGTYILLELVEEGVEIDAIAALRYPGNPEDFDQRSDAESMLRSEVNDKLEALGFAESGDGGLPADMGDHVCVSISYRQQIKMFDELIHCIDAVRQLELFLESDTAPDA